MIIKMSQFPPELIAKVCSYLPSEEKSYVLYDFSAEPILEEKGIILRWNLALEVQRNNSIYINRHEINILKEFDEKGNSVETVITNAQETWSVEELKNKKTINNYGFCVQKTDDYEIIIPFTQLGRLIDILFLIDGSHLTGISNPKEIHNWVVGEIKTRFPDVRIKVKQYDEAI